MAQELYDGAIRTDGIQVERVASDGALLWRWRPPAMPVRKILRVPDGEGVLVLAERVEPLPRSQRTVFRLGADGMVLWVAEIPTGSDDQTYVHLDWEDGELIANTWDCYRVVLNFDDGSVESVVFTK